MRESASAFGRVSSFVSSSTPITTEHESGDAVNSREVVRKKRNRPENVEKARALRMNGHGQSERVEGEQHAPLPTVDSAEAAVRIAPSVGPVQGSHATAKASPATTGRRCGRGA